ncbi:MAG: metallophosphoesterase [Candidatus Nanoarchaeia archaeon]|nr:metallophosphoesterase [Candidatus Nanoarchaeia archaeon]MDD5239599.1 metallophosphoesterase [Candidatus Nanoarchaeia archaeon]
MKIIYATDIHGDYNALRFVAAHAKKTKPDLMIVSGDILDTAFPEPDEHKKYYDSFVTLHKHRTDNKIQKGLEEIANEIIADKSSDKKLKSAASDYADSIEPAKKGMLSQYMIVKKILSETGVPHAVLPGNYDGFGLEELFKEDNLHKKSKKIKNVKISGYGSSNYIASFAIPEHLITDYYEFDEDGKVKSEPYSFFSKEKPQIAVIHNPPRGVLDSITKGENKTEKDNTGEHVGDPELAKYILEKKPKIVLSGHIHGDYGIMSSKDTYFLNPGRLGRGKGATGCFYEIEVDDETGELKNIVVNQIADYDRGIIVELRDFNHENKKKPVKAEAAKPAETEARTEAPTASKVPYSLIGQLGDISYYTKQSKGLAEKYQKSKEPGWSLGGYFDMDELTCENMYPKKTREMFAENAVTHNNYKIIKELDNLDKTLYGKQKEHPELGAYHSKIISAMRNPSQAPALIAELKTAFVEAYA